MLVLICKKKSIKTSYRNTLTAIMNRCGASDPGSPEYGNPKGVSMSKAIEIKNRPVNKLNILSIPLNSRASGTTKLNSRENNKLTITAIRNSAWLPAPALPIMGMKRYKAETMR